MATPTRPCPYCGAAVLTNAPACGTCGRPMPPMQAGAPGAQPAKTMFGYAAPVPQSAARPGSAPPPGQPPRPGQPPAAFTPPQQQGFAPQQPHQPQGFGQPPQQPPQPANPYGQPQQPQGFGQAPPQNPYGQPQSMNPAALQPGAQNPYGQPQQPQGFGQAPPQNPYGQPQQAQNPYGQPQQPQNPYGQPQAQNPYGQPQSMNPAALQPGAQNPYGQPQAQNPYGQPQAQNPYGQPQQNPYGQPQQPPGYPQQGGYPQAQNPFAPPAQDMPGPLDDMARKLPQSAPGTLFGFPIGKLRDPGIQRKILFLAGVALIASIVVPFRLSPTIFAWSTGMPAFEALIWPIIAGGAYLLLTVAPPDMRQKIPPAVLHWLPFGVAFAGIFISKMGFGGMMGGGMGGGGGGGGLYILGYSTLVFGLLARIAQPQDQIARIVIAVGAAMLIPDYFDILRLAFHFSGFPALFILHNLLWFLVITLAVLCILFVVPPQKLPPALQAFDSFGPLICAVLIAWLPVQQLLMALIGLVHFSGGVSVILGLAHGLLPVLAYFGVLMMTSPAAYEEAKALAKGKGAGGGGASGGGYPPQGGGYPPQGGGYPPQGGGYPPQGGGYPPQGGGGWQ